MVDALGLKSTLRKSVHRRRLCRLLFHRLFIRIVGRLYLRLEHTLVNFVVQREKLPEKNPLVLVLDPRILLIELLLYFVELDRVNLLYRRVDIELGVPASPHILQEHGRRLNLADPSQAVLQTLVGAHPLANARSEVHQRGVQFVISAQDVLHGRSWLGHLGGRLRIQ